MAQGERGAVMTVDEARRAIEREGLSGVLWEGCRTAAFRRRTADREAGLEPRSTDLTRGRQTNCTRGGGASV